MQQPARQEAQEGQDACRLGRKWWCDGSTGSVSSAMVGVAATTTMSITITMTKKTALTVVGSVDINTGMDMAAAFRQGSTMPGNCI
jgi:hypothetical protein